MKLRRWHHRRERGNFHFFQPKWPLYLGNSASRTHGYYGSPIDSRSVSFCLSWVTFRRGTRRAHFSRPISVHILIPFDQQRSNSACYNQYREMHDIRGKARFAAKIARLKKLWLWLANFSRPELKPGLNFDTGSSLCDEQRNKSNVQVKKRSEETQTLRAGCNIYTGDWYNTICRSI